MLWSLVPSWIFFLSMASSISLNSRDLIRIMEEIGLRSPVIVGDMEAFSWIASMSKLLYKKDDYVRAISVNDIEAVRQALINKPGVWILPKMDHIKTILEHVPINTFDLRVASKRPLLALTNGLDLASNLSLTIDQQVYVLQTGSLTLTETHVINGKRFVRALGRFNANFNWIQNSEIDGNAFDITKQRMSFHGARLKVFTEAQSPYMSFADGFQDEAVASTEIADTFEVDLYARGMMRDVLSIFGQELNFTTSIFKRFDGQWGSYNSETKAWSGMINSTLMGDADLIATSFSITGIRATAIDYLPVMAEEFYGIAIKNPDVEEWTWVTYLIQFSTELWLAILAVATVLAFVIWLLDEITNHQSNGNAAMRLTRFCGAFWLTFSANFGGKPSAAPKANKSKWTSKVLVFTCLLVGSVIFMSYRASIFAILAAKKVKMPFKNMEEMLKTDYRLMVKAGGAVADRFLKSDPGTVWNQVFQERMTMDDFVKFPEGLSRLKEEHHLGYFWTVESMYSILVRRNEKCVLVFPWVSQYATKMSMGLPKNSPYKKFLDAKLRKIKENGMLQLVEQRWVQKVADCPVTPVRPIHLKKIFSLGVLILFGVILALVIFSLELLNPKTLAETPKQNMLEKKPLGWESAEEKLRKHLECLTVHDFQSLSSKERDTLDRLKLILAKAKELRQGQNH